MFCFSFASTAHVTQRSNCLTQRAYILTRRSNLTPRRAKNLVNNLSVVPRLASRLPLFSSWDQQAAVSLLRMETFLPYTSLLLNALRKKWSHEGNRSFRPQVRFAPGRFAPTRNHSAPTFPVKNRLLSRQGSRAINPFLTKLRLSVHKHTKQARAVLRDPKAVSGGQEKSKTGEKKIRAKKSQEREEEIFRLFPAPTNCPWVSEDRRARATKSNAIRWEMEMCRPLWTHGFRNVISVSEISAVNFMVGWWLLA